MKFRYFFAAAVMGMATATSAETNDWFKNPAQQAKSTFEIGDYEEAAEQFDDAYRKGVAQYRAEKYDDAAESFAAVERPDVAAAGRYNLGNSHFKLGQYDEAIKAYDSISEDNPLYENAQFNRSLAEQLRQQQQQQQSQPNRSSESPQEPSEENQSGNGQSNNNSSPQQSPSESPPERENRESEQRQQSDQPEETHESPPATAQSDESDSGDQLENLPDQASEAATQFDQQQTTDQPAAGSPAVTNDHGAVADNGQHRAADQWLNRVGNDPTRLLRNQFAITERDAEVKRGTKPW